MTDTKTILIAQALISCMMAFLMTGLFSLVGLGPTMAWLHAWMRAFIIAWPVAFCLSIVVSRIAFGIAWRITSRS